ncbi:uncharacterized protein LOC113870055 [Abrus precatorius]|uniref:Uncharacterized protein LOC113870055 n=1 Tax=Abrus precatorius TaxID=3816 RepID=A0A8B8M5L4_ABRPR|nr:uncharacterized protein LOC113870055 [Abrus precatorius]
MCDAVRGSVVQLDDVQAYHNDNQVDRTHLYEKYKGALLVAIAQDDNQNILPIAFAIVEGETADDDIGIISDRHKSINATIRRSNGQWEPPKAFHMYCIRHIADNFLRRFKASYLHKLVVHMGYSRTEHEFNIYYEQLRQRGEIYTDWLDEILREKWVLAYDGGHRWSHMTTNLVECINSVLKGARNLPLIRATYFRLAELFARKEREACARKEAGHIFSEAVMTRVQSCEQASRNLCVTVFDRKNEAFLVQDVSNSQEYKVVLRQRYCDYVDIQTDRYPCCHVIAACSSQNIDWCAYVDDIYKITEICKVYKKEFGVIGNENTWQKYKGPKLCPNPTLKRIIKGRPKSTRFLNEMDMCEMRRPRRCSLCRGESHSRRRCPNAPGSSSQY